MPFNFKAVKEQSQQHLDNLNETYWEHMRFALGVFFTLLSAAGLLLVHMVVPAFFQCSASTRIHGLSDNMRARLNRTDCQ